MFLIFVTRERFLFQMFPRIVNVFERLEWQQENVAKTITDVDAKPLTRSLCKHISVDSTIQYNTWIRWLVSKETVVLRPWGVETNVWFYQW